MSNGDSAGLEIYAQVPEHGQLIATMLDQDGITMRSTTATGADGWQLVVIPQTRITEHVTGVGFELRFSADVDAGVSTLYGGLDDAVFVYTTPTPAPTPTPTPTPVPQPEGAGFHGITNTYAYSSVAEDGDLLVVSAYEVEWVTYPDDAIDTIPYVFTLYRDTDPPSIAGRSIPRAFYDAESGVTQPTEGHPDGYGDGLVALYLTATERDAAGLCDGSDCGPVAAHVALMASPLTGVMTRAGDTIATTDYRTKENLPGALLGAMSALQGKWRDEPQLTVNGVLTDVGEAYLSRVIPNLRAVAPSLHASSVSQPELPDGRIYGAGSVGRTAEDRGGSDSIKQATDELGELLGVDGVFVRGLLTAAFAIGVVAAMVATVGNGGLLVGLAIDVTLVLPVALAMGMVPFEAGIASMAILGAVALMLKVRDWVPTQ